VGRKQVPPLYVGLLNPAHHHAAIPVHGREEHDDGADNRPRSAGGSQGPGPG